MQLSERTKPKDEGWVYVLECEGEFWYVGWSKEPDVRIASHFLGRASICTKTHRPVRIASLTKGCKELEHVTTIALMVQKASEMLEVAGGSVFTWNHLLSLFRKPSH